MTRTIVEPYASFMRGRKQLTIVTFVALSFFSIGLLAPPSADARPPRHKKDNKRGRSGKLNIFCFVKGANVEIDGKKVAVTPLSKPLELLPGEHRVRVYKRGYYEVEEILTVQTGRVAELEADLIAYAGIVQVNANVKDATVAVNGKLVGQTPLDKDIPAGKVELTVQARGYTPYQQQVTIEAGKRHQFNISLKTAAAAATAESSDSVLNKWWFWTSIGLVVAGGTAGAILIGLTQENAENAPFSTDLHLK